jgi:hypothetical protein
MRTRLRPAATPGTVGWALVGVLSADPLSGDAPTGDAASGRAPLALRPFATPGTIGWATRGAAPVASAPGSGRALLGTRYSAPDRDVLAPDNARVIAERFWALDPGSGRHVPATGLAVRATLAATAEAPTGLTPALTDLVLAESAVVPGLYVGVVDGSTLRAALVDDAGALRRTTVVERVTAFAGDVALVRGDRLVRVEAARPAVLGAAGGASPATVGAAQPPSPAGAPLGALVGARYSGPEATLLVLTTGRLVAERLWAVDPRTLALVPAVGLSVRAHVAATPTGSPLAPELAELPLAESAAVPGLYVGTLPAALLEATLAGAVGSTVYEVVTVAAAAGIPSVYRAVVAVGVRWP